MMRFKKQTERLQETHERFQDLQLRLRREIEPQIRVERALDLLLAGFVLVRDGAGAINDRLLGVNPLEQLTLADAMIARDPAAWETAWTLKPKADRYDEATSDVFGSLWERPEALTGYRATQTFRQWLGVRVALRFRREKGKAARGPVAVSLATCSDPPSQTLWDRDAAIAAIAAEADVALLLRLLAEAAEQLNDPVDRTIVKNRLARVEGKVVGMMVGINEGNVSRKFYKSIPQVFRIAEALARTQSVPNPDLTDRIGDLIRKCERIVEFNAQRRRAAQVRHRR